MPYAAGSRRASSDVFNNSKSAEGAFEFAKSHTLTSASSSRGGRHATVIAPALAPKPPQHFDANTNIQMVKKPSTSGDEIARSSANELLLRTKELKRKSAKGGSSLNMSSPLDRAAGERRALPSGLPRGCNCA